MRNPAKMNLGVILKSNDQCCYYRHRKQRSCTGAPGSEIMLNTLRHQMAKSAAERQSKYRGEKKSRSREKGRVRLRTQIKLMFPELNSHPGPATKQTAVD